MFSIQTHNNVECINILKHHHENFRVGCETNHNKNYSPGGPQSAEVLYLCAPTNG
jgi:hypothetical protein